jgi:hypothetical protein
MTQAERQLAVLTALANRSLLKIITGISNHNVENVKFLISSTINAKHSSQNLCFDVSATPEIVSMVRSMTDLPVFASSVDPNTLAQAAVLGADVLELGNYDALYDANQFFNADDVLALTKATLALVGTTVPLSVTIPGHLDAEAHIKLAKQLQTLGVTMLQSEGAVRQVSPQPQTANLSSQEKSTISLYNTQILATACTLPIIAASGITPNNVALAFNAGAAGVGVGRTINQLTSVAKVQSVLHNLLQAVEIAVVPLSQVA